MEWIWLHVDLLVGLVLSYCGIDDMMEHHPTPKILVMLLVLIYSWLVLTFLFIKV